MTRISEAVECLESLGYTVTPPDRAAIDHKAETERLIKFAEGSGSVSAATAAVATATLCLAEQQRIANLIAFVASVQRGVTDTLPSETVMRRAESAGAQAVEGLGLS